MIRGIKCAGASKALTKLYVTNLSFIIRSTSSAINVLNAKILSHLPWRPLIIRLS